MGISNRAMYGMDHATMRDVDNPGTPTRLGSSGVEAPGSSMGGSSMPRGSEGNPYRGAEGVVSAPAVSATSEQVSGIGADRVGQSIMSQHGSGTASSAYGNGTFKGVDAEKYDRAALAINKENYGKKNAPTYGAFSSTNPSNNSAAVMSRAAAMGGTQGSAAVRISNDASDNEPSKTFDVAANAKGNIPAFGGQGSDARGYANSVVGGSQENVNRLPEGDRQKFMAKQKAGGGQ